MIRSTLNYVGRDSAVKYKKGVERDIGEETTVTEFYQPPVLLVVLADSEQRHLWFTKFWLVAARQTRPAAEPTTNVFGEDYDESTSLPQQRFIKVRPVRKRRQIHTNGLASFMASTSRATVFRVTGLPLDEAELNIKSRLEQTIHDHLRDDERERIEVRVTCIPSCEGDQTSNALVEFTGGNPNFLSPLEHDPLSDWQIEMGEDDINFDRHFFGFTQLYPTAPAKPVTADIIAITGLDGHAYGSWRGKGNLGRMWLRDFLSKDLPNCRTMIYGYNSKLSSHGVDTIMDYGREFLEAIKGIRPTQEARERPLFFIAHSFGGIILAHCLVKAVQTNEDDHATIAALYKATYGILFFGTPHKGLVIDDIQRMIAREGHHPRAELLEQIKTKSDLLTYQLVDFKNLIRDRKIVSFYEMQQTRRLELNPDTGWGRTGTFITAVESGSALLDLPDSIETKIPVNADHSQIVKFDNRNFEAYKTATRYLKEFEQNAGEVVLARFSPARIQRAPAFMVPFERDEHFVGRQDALEALESHFSTRDVHNRVVLAGLGGVGKSQIAIEYSYRLRDNEPQIWVFWVHAATAERFEQSYRTIAAKLELPSWDDPKTDIFGLVLRWLSDIDSGRWFMILDNADDLTVFCPGRKQRSQDSETTSTTISLLSYIPRTTNGSLLVTTRDRGAAAWIGSGYTSVIRIGVMKLYEAKLLLRFKIPDTGSIESQETELVEELECLPLAITQAAAYISRLTPWMTVSKYMQLYRQGDTDKIRLLDEESGDHRRDLSVPHSVIRTWQISFDQIRKQHPEASKLLSLMAMLDRQGIPEYLFYPHYQDTLSFGNAVAPLNEFSLITIEKEGNSFEMHRLVQLATKRWLDSNKELEKWQEMAMKILSDAFPNGEPSNWEKCETLLPHTTQVLRKSEIKSNQYMVSRAALLYNMAWYNWLRGYYTLAKEESHESLSIRTKILPSTDLDIFNSMEILALVLQYQGKYDEAEPIYRQTLQLHEKVLGEENPHTLLSRGLLARLLEDQGKYEEAEPILRQTLQLREKVLGQEHPDTLTSRNNLAGLLESQGKYDEAEPIYRQTLQLYEKVLGQEHPHTLTSRNNLAGLLESQGKYDEAEPIYRQTLQLREKVLGQEHPHTLTSRNNLAGLLKRQGKYDEAEPIYRQTLQLREKVLGQEHPHTLMSRNNLAGLLERQGKYDEAEPIYRQTL
ncbi:hypothetical protein BP5796_03069 [Coleophoma crateriformis]|uniref:DUF7779 domain-containing protein n=1 Tax=Coleophoma crateriformis TaxID=565419 RepID=A0A3D8SM25_9HELO|nr:hypothetical protein BP5796_03069 [Coleophoma crateriformis]